MNAKRLCLLVTLVASSLTSTAMAASQQRDNADSVTVTILSSNLADGATVGEWGFSALVEVDGRCVLFDAGRHPDTVLRNADALQVDLSCVTEVVLSHFHFDHTGGMLPLLNKLRADNPQALRRVHVAEGFFLSRRMPGMPADAEGNGMIATRARLEAAGVEIIEHSQPGQVVPGVWVTGPVERAHPETNYPRTIQVNIDGEWAEDHVPDSQGLTILTESGPIVLLGCGHSGAVNLLEQVQARIQPKPIHALMGGMHLFSADDQTLGWTADRLRDIGVQHLMAGHCTGIEPLLRLRTALNLSRRTAVVGAVGSRFVLGEGIHPTAIAQ
ncbi:MAG: MBL fold metallo-hydrolase [Gammaproteobacteria bacterium]|nr:MBL fold metallo-hydrolase [Gammaproteobacteria bacterium]